VRAVTGGRGGQELGEPGAEDGTPHTKESSASKPYTYKFIYTAAPGKSKKKHRYLEKG
jgi:hypothetical protein